MRKDWTEEERAQAKSVADKIMNLCAYCGHSEPSHGFYGCMTFVLPDTELVPRWCRCYDFTQP